MARIARRGTRPARLGGGRSHRARDLPELVPEVAEAAEVPAGDHRTGVSWWRSGRRRYRIDPPSICNGRRVGRDGAVGGFRAGHGSTPAGWGARPCGGWPPRRSACASMRSRATLQELHRRQLEPRAPAREERARGRGAAPTGRRVPRSSSRCSTTRCATPSAAPRRGSTRRRSATWSPDPSPTPPRVAAGPRAGRHASRSDSFHARSGRATCPGRHPRPCRRCSRNVYWLVGRSAAIAT